jgi:hypothetical protein
MHVLFDLLVSVVSDKSPYPAEHPDWFYRDAAGAILPHPMWKSKCLDPASPGFRRFLADYAVRCCTELKADGFCVDGAAYRGGNWNNRPGTEPCEHSHAVFTLLADVREAIRTRNPEAVLIAECFGPKQCPAGDMVCHQSVAWLDWMLERVLDGRLNGAAIQRLTGEHFLAMPKGSWLNMYTHTHDTLAFEKRDLEGPAVSALFAAWALIGAGTTVFAGGCGMRPRPRPNEAAECAALFAAKKALGGVSTDQVGFPQTADPALFVAERPSAQGTVQVIANFSAAPRPSPVPGAPFYSRLGSPSGRILPWDTAVVKVE